MATSNGILNDMPSFQGVDNVIEEKVFAPILPMQVNSIPVSASDSSNQISEPATTIESATSAVTPSTSVGSVSLHSILMNNTSTTNTLPSTSVTASPVVNHTTPVTASHTPKIQSTINQTNNLNHDQILTKTRLQDLVKEIDPCEQLDEEVEDLLLQLVDDFVNSTVNTACIFAKHRNANTVEVKDVQLYLEKMYNMWVPGFGTEEVKPYKKPPITEAHKQRLALIRKSLKKY